MPHNIDLILTLTGGLTAALGLGFATQKLRLRRSWAICWRGILVGPFTPGYVANKEIATQFAEIGVILLMFGVGLHFHLKDLLAVRKIAIPGLWSRLRRQLRSVRSLCGCWGGPGPRALHLEWQCRWRALWCSRVLADHRALHTPTGHIAIGWLIVEDLFTILVLVLLPALFDTVRVRMAGV